MLNNNQPFYKLQEKNQQIYSYLTTILMISPALTGTKLSDIPHHSRKQFSQPNEPFIFFNSKFDSGNLSIVTRNSYDHYSIWTATDAQGSELEGYPKSWFYFQVGGFTNREVTFSIHRVHFLWAMASRSQLYRPVYRVKQCSEQGLNYSEWKRLPHPVESIALNSQQQLVLKFHFYFSKNIKSVQFAFIYPYSHEDCRKDVEDLQTKYENDQDVFFKRYELCKSFEGRVLDVLIISSHEGKDGFQNIKTDQIFTLGEKKLVKFRNNKPIIFISARVHPIQTPSSFTMTGIINFLLNKQDYRSFLLRKYFVFVLVPMLNPDGVSNGHCRMDSLNQNLNRYYNSPDPIKQPSCYSVMKLCEHYNKEQKLFMYLDLHAHPANKGNFIFGNAIFDYIQQVQSHLFPKIISENCLNFQFEQCNFSRKHMKAKDRNQDMNKEGCGRVVFYKRFGLTHSYTLECGYHCNTYNNILKQEQNKNKVYIVRYKKNDKNENIYDNFEDSINETDEEKIKNFVENLKQKKGNNGAFGFVVLKNVKDNLDDIQNEFYKKQTVFFEQNTFYNLGRNICITILDIWNKNPFTRVTNPNQMREEIAERQAKLDRFRKEQVGIRTKQKKIVQLIETKCYGEWHKKNVFQVCIAQTGGFKNSQIKLYQNMKKAEKSITITEIREEEISDSNKKISISKNMLKNKKLINKQERRMGIIQPNIDSIKSISGSDCISSSIPPKSSINYRNFSRPLNLRIRNMQMGNK